MRVRPILLILSCLAAQALTAQGAEQCTAAVISPAAGEGGRPMLWKNRDTDTLSNKVVFVKEAPYGYLALVDADDPSGRRAWAGINTQGFAIINTVAYNLPSRGGDMKDLEGSVMADALRSCRTVADFEAYLKANQGPFLGCQTNFCVFDAEGKAFLFETHSRGYRKYDAAEPPEGYLVLSNYARSGEPGKGAGYLRFERATELAKALPKPLRAEDIFRHLSRDTGHTLLRQPTVHELKGLPDGMPRWITTRDSINKSYTSAAVVLVGKDPGNPASKPMMWVLPGEPVTAVAVPLWPEAGKVPEGLWKGENAPFWAEAFRLKDRIRPYAEKERKEYLDLARLDNREGTGFLPGLLRAEAGIQAEVRDFLAKPRSSAELAEFQEAAARKALAAMKAAK